MITIVRKQFGFAVSAVLAVCACLLVAAPAMSADGGLPGGSCNDSLSQPFLPWLDPANYAFAPDGGFEAGASGWTLGGGAQVVIGNEPSFVHEAGDSFSLSLPVGARAASPDICISLVHPTVRFFARSSGPGLGVLSVKAEVQAGGSRVVVPVGVVIAGSSFSPSVPLPLLANLISPLEGDSASVRLRFTAAAGGVAIDDVYIDPFKVP